MKLWMQTALILALSVAFAGASEDIAIDNAVQACNRKHGTNFNFQLTGHPPRQIQSGGFFFNFISYRNHPNPLLARLFPWLRQPTRHQFVLTTTWKKPLTESTTAGPGGGNTISNTIMRSCSAYLTNQEPSKYFLTCNNVKEEGRVEETTMEVPLISTTKMSSTVEAPETDQMDREEQNKEDDTWDLSRCLGCIFELLGTQG